MKSNRWYTAAGLLLFLLLCMVPNGQGQAVTPIPYANQPAQLALSWTFKAGSAATGGFSVAGLRYWQIVFVPIGTVSTCGISLDASVGSGFTTGGVLSSSTIGSCASATTYANSSATTPTQLGQLTPTITGSGSVYVVLLGYENNPGAAGSSSNTIISPVDGSGYVEMNCKVGCGSSNANGQATMANSAPVTIASDQSAVSTSVSNFPSTYPTTQAGAWSMKTTGATGATMDAAAGAAAAANSEQAGGVYNASPQTPSNGAQEPLQLDSSANLKVNLQTAVPAGANTIGKIDLLGNSGAAVDAAAGATASANSVQGGGVYNSSSPAPSSGQQEPLQLDSSANLKVNIQTALPAGSNGIGSVGVTSLPATPAGTNTIGKIDLLGNSGAAIDAAAGATASANSVQSGGVYNSSPPGPTSGEQEPLQLDSNANLKVNLQTPVPAGTNTIGNVNQGLSAAGYGKVTDGTNTAAVKAASTAAAASDPSLVAALSPNSPLPAGSNTIGQVNTQPAGFASIVAFQQSVTASPVVLSTNSVHGFCVKAMPLNAITVYVGPSGVTTSTGYPLAAGDSVCFQGSNTNLAYVIATTTGASVAVTGN